MRTSLNITNNLNLKAEMRNDSIFQILEYDDLRGSEDVNLAVKLNFMREAGIKLKQVRIILDDSSVQLESGALSYLKGDIRIQNKIGGPLGLGKKLFNSKVTGETMFKPTYSGTGEIFLEPSFGQFALIELQDDEIIVDEAQDLESIPLEMMIFNSKQVSICADFNQQMYNNQLNLEQIQFSLLQ